jgi:hypothetical protein
MHIDDWLKSAEYLPKAMRDFHDAKDLFKTIHDRVAIDKNDYARDVSWVSGQCYVIDIFLWFMAKRGYTLQRSRKRLPFSDLGADVAESKRIRDQAFFDGDQAFFDALNSRNKD